MPSNLQLVPASFGVAFSNDEAPLCSRGCSALSRKVLWHVGTRNCALLLAEGPNLDMLTCLHMKHLREREREREKERGQVWLQRYDGPEHCQRARE